MAFLAPALLAGLTALAVPIYLHLVQREKKIVVEFPSLMFLRKIPYKSVRRRKVRNLVPLLLRCAAVSLVVLAFARPFFGGGALAAVAGGGARDVVILLDRSYSMGYGDHWTRARAAAREAIGRLAPDDRATVVLFDTRAEIGPRTTLDRAALLAYVDQAAVGPAATRDGVALKAAASLIEASDRPRHQVVLISDFQKLGWDRTQPIGLPPATTLTTVSVADSKASDAGVAGLGFDRDRAGGRERLIVTARLTNRGAAPVTDRDVTLEVDGRALETKTVSLGPNGSAAVTFQPFAVPAVSVRGVVRLAPDELPADDTFTFMASPGATVPVLVVDGSNPAPDASLYLTRALDVGRDPSFDVRGARADTVTAADIDGSAVVVLNDTPPPAGAAGRALARFVEGGGGLLVALGERSRWPEGSPDLLPGTFEPPVDRLGGRGGSLGFVEYSHPVFELFRAPQSGDLTAVRVYRYRPLAGASRVLARFDDGAVALAERRVGDGRVLVWTSTLDTFWNDLALRPVYVPFVHQAVKYLASYVPPVPSYTVGAAVDPAAVERARRASGLGDEPGLMVVTPSGRRLPFDTKGAPITLDEAGLYELRGRDSAKRAPVMAANVDPAESDLTPLDPAELVAAATATEPVEPGDATPETTAADREHQQSLWWYLVVAALLVLLGETLLANRMPRTMP